MLILSHRGSDWQHNSNVKENTLEAFKLSVEKELDGIETDVRINENNELVLKHDPVVEGEDNLLLTDFLDWAPDNLLLNLEIKEPRCVNQLAEIVSDYKNKQYLITSFNHRAVWRFNNKIPNIECGIIISCFPIMSTILEQMIPATFTHVVWEYEIYDHYLASQMNRHEHFLYNVPEKLHHAVDGIITDHG